MENTIINIRNDYNTQNSRLRNVSEKLSGLEIYFNKDKVTKNMIIEFGKLINDIIAKYRTIYYDNSIINIFGLFINTCIIYVNKFTDDKETFEIIKQILIIKIFTSDISFIFGTTNGETLFLINNNYDHPILKIYIETKKFRIEHFKYFDDEFIDNLLIKYYDKIDFSDGGYIIIVNRKVPQFTKKYCNDFHDKLDDKCKIILWRTIIKNNDIIEFKSLCDNFTEISNNVKKGIIECLISYGDIEKFDYLYHRYDGELNITYLEILCKLIGNSNYYDIEKHYGSYIHFLKYILERKIIPNKNCFDSLVKTRDVCAKLIVESIELLIFHGYVLTYEDILLLASREIDLGNYEDFKSSDDGRLYNLCIMHDFHPSYFNKLKCNENIFYESFKHRLKLGDIRDSIKRGMKLDIKCLQNACAVRDNISVLKFLLGQGLVPDETCLKNLMSETKDKSVKLIINAFILSKEQKEIKEIKKCNLELIPLPKDFNVSKLIPIPKNFLNFRNFNHGTRIFPNKKYSFTNIKKKILLMLRSCKIISVDSKSINADNFILNGYIKLSDTGNIVPIELVDELIYTLIEYNKANEHKEVKLDIELAEISDNVYNLRTRFQEIQDLDIVKFKDRYYLKFYEIMESVYKYIKENNMIVGDDFVITGVIREILNCKENIKVPMYMLDRLVYTMLPNHNDGKKKIAIKKDESESEEEN
jgi:hypothetical protein